MKTTLKHLLELMSTRPRVEFKLQMCKDLQIVIATIDYWKKTNIIPLYAQNYLLEQRPKVDFDFTPFVKPQTRKDLNAC